MIAVDAMGGDNAPRAVVYGAYYAAQRLIPVTLYGNATVIERLLTTLDKRWQRFSIQIVHCSEVITMTDTPSKAVLQKKDSSLVRAVYDCAKGKVSAVVSAGNSGACLVAGTLILKRVKGVLRPAIAHFLPKRNGSVFCLDLGANTDCKPEYLEQFAHLGSLYSSMVLKCSRPKVALLSNGAEAYKGSQLVKESYERLSRSTLNFVGNIEPRELFSSDVDVLVCDGFAGNVLLKTVQGTAQAVVHWMKEEASRSWLNSLGFFLASGVVASLKKRVDYMKKGGAVLLGVEFPLIVAHGSSDERSIEAAIVQAHALVESKQLSIYNKELERSL